MTLTHEIELSDEVCAEYFYLVETESYRPDDLRSGVETRSITIHDQPALTNMSLEPRVQGWLGTSNNINSHALGSGTWNDLIAWLTANDWIPLTEAAGAEDDEIREAIDDDGDCRVYVPGDCRLIEIANVFGNDGLDRYLCDCAEEVIDMAHNKNMTAEEIADYLDEDAASRGYRLVGTLGWVERVLEANQ